MYILYILYIHYIYICIHRYSIIKRFQCVSFKCNGPGPVELLLEAVPTERRVKNPTCLHNNGWVYAGGWCV